MRTLAETLAQIRKVLKVLACACVRERVSAGAGANGVWKTSRRQLRTLIAAFAFAALPAATLPVLADANPANDSASIEITITPSLERGVVIDTDTVNLNLGNVEMNSSTQTVSPATVTILGNVTNTELLLSADITGGWSFDDNVSAGEQDRLQVWTVFKTTQSSAVPSKSGSNFDDANDALTPAGASALFPAARVGLANGDTGNDDRFEDGSINMDSLAPFMKRHWWFYFRTPPVTSTVNEQRIRFILTVEPGP